MLGIVTHKGAHSLFPNNNLPPSSQYDMFSQYGSHNPILVNMFIIFCAVEVSQGSFWANNSTTFFNMPRGVNKFTSFVTPFVFIVYLSYFLYSVLYLGWYGIASRARAWGGASPHPVPIRENNNSNDPLSLSLSLLSFYFNHRLPTLRVNAAFLGLILAGIVRRNTPWLSASTCWIW